MFLVDLAVGEDQKTKIVKVDTYKMAHATGSAKTELHEVLVERGMSWEEAVAKADLVTAADEGFYVSREVDPLFKHGFTRIVLKTDIHKKNHN